MERTGRRDVGLLLEIEDLGELLLDLRRRQIVERLEIELVLLARGVDGIEDLEHAPEVGAGLGHDEEVARHVRDDARVLRGELGEHAGRHLLGGEMHEAMDARHVALLGGDVAALDGRELPRDVLRLDDLEEAGLRHDREPVGGEHGEEGLVRLGDGDLLRRVNARLRLGELRARDHEALAGELADDANELAEVGVFELEIDLVGRELRLVLERGVERRG